MVVDTLIVNAMLSKQFLNDLMLDAFKTFPSFVTLKLFEGS